jgi:hypothetical protein
LESVVSSEPSSEEDGEFRLGLGKGLEAHTGLKQEGLCQGVGRLLLDGLEGNWSEDAIGFDSDESLKHAQKGGGTLQNSHIKGHFGDGVGELVETGADPVGLVVDGDGLGLGELVDGDGGVGALIDSVLGGASGIGRVAGGDDFASGVPYNLPGESELNDLLKSWAGWGRRVHGESKEGGAEKKWILLGPLLAVCPEVFYRERIQFRGRKRLMPLDLRHGS